MNFPPNILDKIVFVLMFAGILRLLYNAFDMAFKKQFKDLFAYLCIMFAPVAFIAFWYFITAGTYKFSLTMPVHGEFNFIESSSSKLEDEVIAYFHEKYCENGMPITFSEAKGVMVDDPYISTLERHYTSLPKTESNKNKYRDLMLQEYYKRMQKMTYDSARFHDFMIYRICEILSNVYQHTGDIRFTRVVTENGNYFDIMRREYCDGKFCLSL